MKNRLLSILFVLLAGTGAVFAQSEVTPPAFNGAVIRVFMTPPCSGAFSWGAYRWWSIAFAFS